MTKFELLERTKKFSIRIIRLVDAIPDTKAGRTIANQIIRSGTSVGANYRAACRSKSDKDFLNKLVIVEEEADETCYWIELLIDAGMMSADLLDPLLKETNELTAIFTASGKTVRQKISGLAIKDNTNPKSEIRNPK